MPRPRPSVCAQPGCPNLTPCETHPPREPWSGSTRRAELPPDWARRRRQRFEQDDWTCTEPGCTHHDPTGRTLECDHIGDKHDHRIESLRTKCKPHHLTHTLDQARAGRDAARTRH